MRSDVVRSLVAASLAGWLASGVACGARTLPLDAEARDGGPDASGAAGAAGTAGDGAASDAAGEAAKPSWGEVCLEFFAVFNASHGEQSCQSCLFHAVQGGCAGGVAAMQSSTGPCGHANDCAGGCACEAGGCTEKTCTCIATCMHQAPDECLDAWTAAYACLREVCDGAGC